jgi:hypothetical protein
MFSQHPLRVAADAFFDRFATRCAARVTAFRRHDLTGSTPISRLILSICAGQGRV